MKFDWNLKEHHKLCMDEGLIVRSCVNYEYAMIKDEEGGYCLFRVKPDMDSDYEEIWEKIASSKTFSNFRRKVAGLFIGGEE